MNAGKNRELSEISIIAASGDHLTDFVEKRFYFVLPLAFEAFSEQRSGGFVNGATIAEKTDFFDAVPIQGHENGYVIAAKRIVPLGGAVGALEFAKIARTFAMVEDDLLIEVG